MLILSLLTLVHLVAASSLLRVAHPVKMLNIRDLVVARQSSTGANATVPAECTTICDPINAVVAQGCSPEDCCQSTFITGYADCLECVGSALGATNFTAAQQALDDLTAECDSRGLDIPSLTLSVPVASGALSSAPATVISTQSTDALTSIDTPTLFTIVPALSTNTGAQSTDIPAQSTNAPAQSTDSSAQSADTPTQSAISPAQTTNTTSSAKQSCLIPRLLHVQISVVLLGGLVHLVL